MASSNNKPEYTPCTPDHDIEELGIPYGPYLSIENNFFLYLNISFGPIEVGETDEILFDQLSSLVKNPESSFYPYPADGYKKPINPETGMELPFCCNYYNKVYEEANKWFNVFPNCCSRHKRMSQSEWFDKTSYNHIPKKIVYLLSQTIHLITEQIENPNWENAIISYIDYNFICFHHYAVGLNIYLKNLERYVLSHKDIVPAKKAKVLVDHIRHIGKHYQLSVDNNYKLQVLDQYAETFPFEHLNLRNIDSSKGDPLPLPFDTNTKEFKYDLTRYLVNEKKVLASLLKITSMLLSSIDAHDNNLLSYSEKKELELLLQKRKLKIKYGYKLDDSKKPDYVKMLEEWLNDEIEFLREIKPLLPEFTPEMINPESMEQNAPIAETNNTRQLIEEQFTKIGSKGKYGWEYAFRNKKEYDLFVDILEMFFTHQDYEIPSDTIKLRHGCKTQMATALGVIHDELGEQLSSDTRYFEIIRALNHFQNESQASIYKALTRHRI